MLQAVVEKERPHTKSASRTFQSGTKHNLDGSLQHQREKGTRIVNKPYTYPPKQLFTVSGPRKVMEEDDKGKTTSVKLLPEAVRFETVLEEHAVAFAQDVYRRENIILDITSSELRP